MTTRRDKGQPPRRVGLISIKTFLDAASAESHINQLMAEGWKVLDSKIRDSGYEFILLLPPEVK